MDLDDIAKDIERIGSPMRTRERRPDLSVKNGRAKAFIFRLLALSLLAAIAAFSVLVLSHYRSSVMALIVLVYVAVGGLLAYKLFSLTYTGWLYTFFLSLAGIILPLLALATRGLSNPALTMGAIAVFIISAISAALLWWVKDLLGIKSYREIFMPYA